MAELTSNHRPTRTEHEDLHLENSQVAGVRGTVPKRVLPRTDVPEYLEETPMQEQNRHNESFHTNQPQAMQAGHTDGFSRPGLEDNLKLIAENLADSDYFDMPYRHDYATDKGSVTTGDGTDGTVV